MSEIYNRQKMQEEIQKSDDFADVFGKLVSGKVGYKTVIEKKPMIIKCESCQTSLDINQKFCHECGAKNEIQEKK